MPVTPTYPGVYIEELESPVHPITGVATSIAAFVGYAQRGPADVPTTVLSFTDYSRRFGGLWAQSTMSFAVSQFFQNGGTQAVIVRAVDDASAVTGQVDVGSTHVLTLQAAGPGAWSQQLRVRVDDNVSDPVNRFNLSIKDEATGVVEVLRNLPAGEPLRNLVNAQSQLVHVPDAATLPTAPPDKNADVPIGQDPFETNPPVANAYTPFPDTGAGAGADGDTTNEVNLIPAAPNGKGVYALEKADLFNLLCIPPPQDASANAPLSPTSLGAAADFCAGHRALFVVDSEPTWSDAATIATPGGPLDTYIASITASQPYAAIYFPYVRAPDPLQGNAIRDFPPCGIIAGVFARTDAARGVWKAPAGLDAGLSGIQELKVKLTDSENGLLNPLGLNCLRTFPAAGSVVWGARTIAGADKLANQWKYVPVRRTANFIEESLYRGTQWVVFESNDEPLWGSIRLNVGAFMHDLFRQGAFQGSTPRQAYLVKCDGDTTTQTDINNGVVNILVGFAPLKPAEFVIIQIQQLAGQIQT